jgi:hypothetical protein
MVAVMATPMYLHNLSSHTNYGMAAPGWSRGGSRRWGWLLPAGAEVAPGDWGSSAITILGRAAAASMGGAGASGSKPLQGDLGGGPLQRDFVFRVILYSGSSKRHAYRVIF